MYSEVFCRVYNAFGWNYYPEIFGEQLLQWLEENGVTVRSCLDLACGTGVLCEILHRTGAESWGMDLSEGMIAIARESCPQIHYDVADMTLYRPEKQFDLVTCTGDALNHITALSDVEQIFRNVYACTAPGGYFIFDILNENEISDSEPFEMDFTDRQRIWFQMTRPETDRVNLTVRVFEEGKLSFEEIIREAVYDVSAICRLLQGCGFELVRCADSLLDDSGHGTTWFVIARKPR